MKYGRVTDEEIKSMVTRWENGESYTDISKDFELTPQQVSNKIRYHLKKNGLIHVARAHRQDTLGQRSQQAAQLLLEGYDADELAEEFGVARETLLKKTSSYRKQIKKEGFTFTNKDETSEETEDAIHHEDDLFSNAATSRWLQGQNYHEIADSLSSSPQEVGASIRNYLSRNPQIIRKFLPTLKK
jgi:hypothetical protein